MVISNRVGQVKTFPLIKIYPFEKEIWFMFTCNLEIIFTEYTDIRVYIPVYS